MNVWLIVTPQQTAKKRDATFSLSLDEFRARFQARPRKDKRGVDLVSDALPFGRLWYAEPDAISNAVGYAKLYSRSQDAVIRVYDESGNVIQTHEHKGDFREFELRTTCA